MLIRGTAQRYPTGSGYDRARVPQFFQPEQVPAVTDGLSAAGWSDDDVRKIVGGNWMRVARQVWRPANWGGLVA